MEVAHVHLPTVVDSASATAAEGVAVSLLPNAAENVMALR